MKHPSQETLALQAGGDLGFYARWVTGRHVAQCEVCRKNLAAFRAVREIASELNEIPEVPWNRLAAEMKANIRLGLAAGECVRAEETPLRDSPLFSGARVVVALASVMALLVAGLVLEHPAPGNTPYEGVVVQTTADGIQVREGGQALRLTHPGASNVTYSAGAQGSLRARFVDPETGYVTVNNVSYAEGE
ncbi:MAG TPA: hypothetical protein VG675_09220 [Bryobacteraceae bacterium]|nr:hypothetical protein [Bryobacteraceae bacterium]